MNKHCHSEQSCCKPQDNPTALPSTADVASERPLFDIEGFDCVEEVNILKKAIGPLVGGEDKLAFDVLKGRMMLLPDALGVDDRTIIDAVAETGMKAERKFPDREQDDIKKRQTSHAMYALFSGLFIAVGFSIHMFEAFDVDDFYSLLHLPYSETNHWPIVIKQLGALIHSYFEAASPWYEKAAFALAVALGLRHVLPKAWYAIKNLRADMNLLMSVAVVGAMVIDQWFEAASVSFLFALSLTIESWSVGRARHAIEALLELAPETARIKNDAGEENQVPAAEVAPGTRFVVAPGERVPLDGTVVGGTGSVNQAPITGESIPIDKQSGDTVYAGSINGNTTLEIESNKAASDTALAHIIRLVEAAHANRAPAEQWVEKFARIYTPAVMLGAVAVFLLPPLLLAAQWHEWFYRALVLLVIACPCALVISTPVSIVAAIASAARQGVLIKGGLFVELPARLNAIAFDKTGTLTGGKPFVTGVYPFHDHSDDYLLCRAAALEARSSHPLAQAVLRRADELGIEYGAADEAAVLPGKGMSGSFNQTAYWLGSHRYVLERGLESPEVSRKALALERDGQTVIAVGNDNHVCGLIAISDRPRPGIETGLRMLRKTGIEHLVMLTGDNRLTAENIAQQLGLDEVHAELLPGDKVVKIGKLLEQYGQVAMVGDGINDAPALAQASLGIAMAAMGSDAAVETADIALMGDDLNKLPWLIRHSKRTLRIIRQNIVFALALKAAFAVLAFAGMATLWAAIAADMGASLLVVANGLRLLHPKPLRLPETKSAE
ncbi:MAG: heavy metal translocating P-type ATPase [Gammaproteobacteria bacterium]